MIQLMPGVIEDIPVDTHFEPVAFDSRFCTLLATSEFYFGPSTRYQDDFIATRPIDEADRRAGRICSASGFWFAGHDVVIVDGLPYGRRYAPRGRANTRTRREGF